ncbi:MAG TPA: 5'-3' exonuclease H3TH domain-containing protein [Rhodanobacteraceae bacterium]|nr:5'-3' exonuclease H3TH domain-containing protein [Rhodanobacteraceae bacterium]
MEPVKRIHLVDASMYVFRAWHSMPDRFFDHRDESVNAVQGFCGFLLDFLERARPSHAVMAFDVSLASSFRNAIYPAYKANRAPAPPNLSLQFEYCRELAAALGFVVLADVGYEADDLIGSVACAMREHGYGCVIVSADKDFGQLLGQGDEQWDFARGQRWGAAGVFDRLGVHAHQVVDYLALAGDAIDNIPGVPGIGAKTAAALLAHFGSLDALLERIDEVPYLRLRGAAGIADKLRRHTADARLAQQLTAIALDAPVPCAPDQLRRQPVQAARLDDLLQRLRFGSGTRMRLERIRAMATPDAADEDGAAMVAAVAAEGSM